MWRIVAINLSRGQQPLASTDTLIQKPLNSSDVMAWLFTV